MTRDACAGRPERLALSPGATALAALPMLAVTGLLVLGPRRHAPGLELAVALFDFGLINAVFVAMLATGKTDRYRAPLYTLFGILFVLGFIGHMVETRGTMSLSEEEMIRCRVPFCHIVIPMTLVPAALTRTIIFPGAMTDAFAAIGSMFVIWIGASLALGRGWCSWGCFLGPLDNGFSMLRKRTRVMAIDPRLRVLPWAVLLVVVLASAAALSPAYCEWLCPFKTVTEFAAVTNLKILIQTIIFVSLFVVFVVVGPLVTGRRTQCALFCPFGAFQSLTNRVNAFDVVVDRSACTDCGLCGARCPTLSIDRASVAAGRTLSSCTRCGQCVDVCPRGALSFHVKGTPVGARPWLGRLLFLYPAFLFLAIFSSRSIQDGLLRLIHLVTTGRLA